MIGEEELLELNINDDNVLILNINEGDRTSVLNEQNLFKKFLFPNEKITQSKLKKILRQIGSFK